MRQNQEKKDRGVVESEDNETKKYFDLARFIACTG